MPNLYIIAGPNGAGKTTFAKEFLPHYAKCQNFVNADLIASGLAPFSPTSARIKASRLLLAQIDEYVEKNASFAMESTLSGRTYLRLLEKLKQKNYSIHIFFLWIPDPRLAKERIKQRVREGGHHVPALDVERRFTRSTANFFQYYEPLCHTSTLYDNSGSIPHLVARKIGDHLIIKDKNLFDKITKTQSP